MPDLLPELLAGNRRALAKAITLQESVNPEDEALAQDLIAQLKPKANSIRIGITGMPGVGKSSFIETFGIWLIERGKRVAVLSIDPSSSKTGGSILGDKTRMPRLSTSQNAFVRPSPSGGALGGVTRRSSEAVALCEAAGYEVILVETVGVGQSETQVANITDLFVLITMPNCGDELQGIKRGIMELSDICLINKSDLDTAAANQAKSELMSALSILAPHEAAWQPRIIKVSAMQGLGLNEFWQSVLAYSSSINLQQKRRLQAALHFDELLKEAVWRAFECRVSKAEMLLMRNKVELGNITALQGVKALL